MFFTGKDRGVLLRLMDRAGEAVKDLEKVAELDPGLIGAWLNLASLYKLGNRCEGTCAQLGRIMSGPMGAMRAEVAAAYARDRTPAQ